jgi:molecular chaperone GrpE
VAVNDPAENDTPDDDRDGQPAVSASSEAMAALEAERASLQDRLLRLAAECDNWKKRAAREQEEAGRRAEEEVLREMLEVVDGLERAVAAMGDGALDPVREGVALVLRNLLQRLASHGIQPIGAVGHRFDPRLHDAVARAPSRDVAPGTVLAELQRGYTVRDRLLRPASVVVAETADPPAREPRS